MLTSTALAARFVHRSEPTGREVEFRLLRHALDRCLQGRGGVVALAGAVGTGRTELLHVFSDAAAELGVRVLSAAGSPLEKDFPFGVVRQLFQSAGLGHAADAEVARLLGEDSDAPAGDGGARLTPRALHELCSIVLELAERSPLLLAVDDRQDADVQSLEFLLYLVRRTRSARVLTVLSSRETMTPPNPFFEVELARQPHHERIRLGLLPAGLVSDTLRERFGADAALRLTTEAHALTGGNPLLVQALLEDQEPERARRGLVVGESYRRGLMNCLHRMDPLALRCARGVAVLGRPAEEELLAELLLLAPQSLARASYLLHAAGLFHDGDFRHPTGGGDLLAAMTPEELAALHRRAAQLLRASGAPAARVAEQLRSAEGHLRTPWAASSATALAATLAADPGSGLGDVLGEVLSDCDPDETDDWAELSQPVAAEPVSARTVLPAQRGPQPQQLPQTPRILQGPAARPAPYERLSRLSPLRLGSPLPPDPGPVEIHCVPWLPGTVAESAEAAVRRQLKSVRYLFWHGRVAEGIAALERFEAELAPGSEPEGLRELRSWLGYWFRSLFPQRPSTARPAARPAPGSSAEAAPEDGLNVLGGMLAGLSLEESVLKAERILRDGRLGGSSVQSLTSALTVLVYADRADRAAHWCEPIAARTDSNCSSTWHALFSALRAETALRQGDLRTAEEASRAAFARIRPEGWGIAVGYPLSTMISVRTALGRHDDAARYLALAVPEESYRTPAGLHYRYARGGHLLAVGRAEEALADFRACGETMARWDVDHLPGIVPWRVGAAQAELALGRRRSALALADRQLAVLGAGGHARVRGMALRVRAAAGDATERTGLLERAVDALEASGDRVQVSAALGELSAAHQAQGDPGSARLADRRARPGRLHTAGSAGADGPRPVPAEPAEEGGDLLSDAERRVAELAANGLTNREIARKLYVTVSTVEQHLTRVYRKLGIRRRVDLRRSPYLGGELAG